MAPGRKRGGKGAKTKSELSLGDLVLAKVKGFPAWPAKIGRPEDWERVPDPKKYFVQFFGTAEIAFVAPADIQAFTSESKNKLSVRCQGKTVKFFAQAVKEICEEFDVLQQKNLSSIRDDDNNNAQNLASEARSPGTVADEGLLVSADDEIDIQGPNCELEIDGFGRSLPSISPGKKSKPYLNPSKPVKDSVLGSVKEEVSHNVKVDGGCSDSGDLSKLAMGLKRKREGAVQMKHASAGKMKVSSADNPLKLVKDSVLVSVLSSHASVEEEVSHNVKVEGGCSDGGQSELVNNSHQSKLAMGIKRKHDGAVQMKYGSGGKMKVSSADNSSKPVKDMSSADNVKVEGGCSDGGQSDLANSGDMSKLAMGLKTKGKGTVQMKEASGGDVKALSADNSKLDSGKKVKKFVKENKHSVAVDDRVDREVISDEHREVSSKKTKIQHDYGKLTSRTIEASCPAKISKAIDAVDGTKMVRAQTSRKNDHISHANLDKKMDNKEPKRLISDGKAENHQSLREDNPTAENDPPSTKRHCRTGGMTSTALISESINGNSASSRSGMANPNPKVRPSGMQLTTKRRAVRLCDDDDDELPKTPVHGRVSVKSPVIPRVLDSKKKTLKHEDGCPDDRLVSRKPGINIDALKEQIRSTRLSKQILSPTAQKGMEMRIKETSPEHVSPNQCQLDAKKSPFIEAKSAVDSTQSVTAAKPLAELPKKQLSKTPVSIAQKKVPFGANVRLNTATDGSSLNQLINERSKPTSPGERRKSTPLSHSQITDSVISVGNPDEKVTTLGERLDVRSDSKTSSTVNSKISDAVTSMKHLIAAAQARKKQAHLENSYMSHFPLGLPDADMVERSRSSTPVELSKTLQLDVQGLHPNPPFSDVRQISSANGHENDELEEMRVSSGHQATGSCLSGNTEAAVTRDTFEGMIETLSRTKESIGRATRLAIDCAKYGIANEVVELLIRKLENEPSLHRKVDLFFLVDSITQCSHNQKGIAGASYIPIIQSALSRLLGAAAPPGTGAHENRRQCHKVLRLWLERKILPESVLRRYMDDIGAKNDETSTGISHRRPSRAERAIDDPIRDMEGMFVDEYGSNATFQLAGLLPSHFFDEEDEEEDNIPAQHKEIQDTPPSEDHTPASRDPEDCTVTPSDRHHCFLEDVDGELEMEDVSAHQKDEEPFSGNDTALHEPNSDRIFQSAEFLHSPEGSPPLPPDSPPDTPPLPHSPPPPPPPPSSPSRPLSPPPPPPPPPTLLDPHLFPPPPPPPPPAAAATFISEQSFPPQPALVPQHMHHIPPTAPHHAHMISNTHGSRIDAPVRGEIYSQQSSFFSPAVREHAGYNSSRLVEYRQNDGYLNTQGPQQTQPFRPGSVPFAQRPLHPEQITQQIPNHFSYPNTAQQNLFPPYPVPNFPHRMWATRGKSCSALPYSHEGYFGGAVERPPANVVSFQPSGANSIPVAPITAHGSHMMPSRPDVSAVNWRPA